MAISLILTRTFSDMVGSKIRCMVDFDIRQKGFAEGDGCFTNASYLHELMRFAKGSSIAAAILCIGKAFDVQRLESGWSPTSSM